VSTRSKLILSLVTVAALVAAVLAAAVLARSTARDDGFVIDRFDRAVVVEEDGSLAVTELIEVTFLQPRRGIFRDLEAQGPAGGVVYDLEAVDQGDEGAPWNYAIERTDDGEPRVRIGDADVVLDPGPQTYRLRYRVAGLLFRPEARPDQVQLRLDVPGDGWPTDVVRTQLTVTLPATPSDVRCVAGTAGTVGGCGERSVDGTTVRQQVGELAPRETATVAIELPAAALGAASDRLPVVQIPELEHREKLASLGVPLVPATLLLLLLLAAPAAVLEAVRAGKVYRDVVTDAQLHDRVTPTAEFEPPDGLAPAELAAVCQRSIGGEELLATLIDLEVRGVVATEASQGATRITVGPGRDPAGARPWEAEALEALCPGGRPTTFGDSYDPATATRSSAATRAVAAHARGLLDHGSAYVHEAGGVLRSTGGYALLVVVVLAVGGVVGLVGAPLLDVPFPALVTAWIGLAVAWALLALVWRKERLPLTSEGRDVIARAGTFRTFLQEVHADRLTFAASRQEVGTTHPAVAMLPYAMALGLADSWLERFEPLLVEAARSGRAGSTSSPDAWYLHRSTFVAATAAHSTTITDPSSSSSGGGGAGSGGGGGGGGSW
jgi:hypothetical protein